MCELAQGCDAAASVHIASCTVPSFSLDIHSLSASPRELHEKYVVLGERMEALVREEAAVREAATAETEAARLAVQVGGLECVGGLGCGCQAWGWMGGV